MLVEFSESVEDDLDEIAAYIARDNPRRALTFVQEIREEILRIGDGPHHYRLRPDIGEDALLTTVGRYVILFWVGEDFVRVERVVQGNRLLSPLY